MLPHSQTGNAKPDIDNINRRKNGLFGKILASFAVDIKRRIKAEMIIPRMRKGRASIIILSVIVRKSCNIVAVSLNQTLDLSLISHNPN